MREEDDEAEPSDFDPRVAIEWDRRRGTRRWAVRLKSNGSPRKRQRESARGAAKWLDQDKWLGSDMGSSPSNSEIRFLSFEFWTADFGDFIGASKQLQNL